MFYPQMCRVDAVIGYYESSYKWDRAIERQDISVSGAVTEQGQELPACVTVSVRLAFEDADRKFSLSEHDDSALWRDRVLSAIVTRSYRVERPDPALPICGCGDRKGSDLDSASTLLPYWSQCLEQYVIPYASAWFPQDDYRSVRCGIARAEKWLQRFFEAQVHRRQETSLF